MKLVNRISVFFLAAMAVILAATSAMVYWFVRYELTSHLDADVRQAFNTLVAAVEVEEDDVKWEPGDHKIALAGGTPVSWCVITLDGRVIDESPDDDLVEELGAQLLVDDALDHPHDPIHRRNGWQYLTKRLAAPKPKPAEERDPEEYAALTVAVGHPSRELASTLNAVALASTLLPLVVWGIFALAGRWICAKALQPLTRMAQDARALAPADRAARLSLPVQRDELHDLGVALNGALDRLQVSLARQEAFVGNAAHQLRTPLTALSGQIEVCLRRERAPNEYVDTLLRARHETGELRRVLDALLFLAHASREEARASSQAIALKEWLPRYAERWRSHARWQEMDFTVTGSPRIDAPPELLRQVLDNLIDNAIKYSPAGGLIRCAAVQEGNAVTISVTDSGIGISAADQPHLFQPFFRSEEARKLGVHGDGLGLATVREIVELLGGTLHAESVVPAGTRFSVRFPSDDRGNRP